MSVNLKTFDIACLGEAMVEFNESAGPQLYRQGFGGDTSNAVIAAARAGARTTYLTKIGNDHWGSRLLQLWQQEGVDTSAVELDGEAHTAIYFVHHDKQGHHFSYLRKGSAASQMNLTWLERKVEPVIQQSTWLHVSGISLSISQSARETVLQAMQRAKQAGVKVSLDSNLRLKLWDLPTAKATLAQALDSCDLFLPSFEDMQQLLASDSTSDMLRWCEHVPQVVLKLGAAGALVSNRRSHTTLPGHKVDAKDATGAGDCFAGNLLARLCAGDCLEAAARYANAAAALSVQGFGAVEPLPTQEQVKAFFANA